MIEYFFPCPHCFARISILIDPGTADQHYIEDCEVCCNPIEFEIAIRDGEVTKFETSRPQ